MSTTYSAKLPEGKTAGGTPPISIRDGLEQAYPEVFTSEAIAALGAMSRFNGEQKALMVKRMKRRMRRIRDKERIAFPNPDVVIPRTQIRVQDARDGKFEGSEIPADLERQWIQGTGPASRPNARVETSIRNVAYALLSGADGWMFDGEDALGQIASMSLENQRNLKLALDRDPLFLKAAERVAGEMNAWAEGFLGKPIVADWRKQLDFTTVIFRARGLHLDDRHIRDQHGVAMSASIVDTVFYVVHNHKSLRRRGASIVLYLPKIQVAEEAALWNDMLSSLERYLDLEEGAIKTYVLVEQLEATFQLMEIRAVLGKHFVGYNTGRWDYINSVADAMTWDPEFINPNIEAITMTYGYMRNYEDRVRRAVNTPDVNGNCALWQGGMEPNIPVGSEAGVASSMERAVAGAVREQEAGASGKWVAHWKMVHIVRPVWEKAGEANQMGREFPPLTYTAEDGEGLTLLESAPRTIRGARDLLSVAVQYGNAFAQGFQAAALKPADFFDDDDVLFLMEDMATGEIRLSILWEWIHKEAALNEDDPETGIESGDTFTVEMFKRLLAEEYEKLLAAKDKDVHDDSKRTTLPVAREIARTYVLDDVKAPWYIDLLNINLNNHDLTVAKERISRYMSTLKKDGTRITENLDFPPVDGGSQSTGTESDTFEAEIVETGEWMAQSRFNEITRLYTARQVVEQRGTIPTDYTVAREAAGAFYRRLRELFESGRSITTFGPYSPGQAVQMKRLGIEGIYLGGWATSAKGSVDEDPGPDLASYPLSQVPNEASSLVRALLAADKNQRYARAKMSADERKNTPVHDYRPFIIADADTGHGGEAHVRNLIRRFVEAGVPGYHIEDQKPGVKKCGHQAGKVLVALDEQIKRLNSARFQLDLMGVPGIIVARTDAEAATYLDNSTDERDHSFIFGATNTDVPNYKSAYLAILKRYYDQGVPDINGHLMYGLSDTAYATAYAWLDRTELTPFIDKAIEAFKQSENNDIEGSLDEVINRFLDVWQLEASMKTYPQAVADLMTFMIEHGSEFDVTVEEWLAFANNASLSEAQKRASTMDLHVVWDSELARTPEGYYQIKGGIEYAIAKSLAVAPFTDLIWMETKTADLADAREFAEAIHAVYPDKMLAYNLSPSFSWDTTGMNDDEMRNFPAELGKLGFVFNFITYGGHQIDGLAAEEFATALREDGMLALARLQRKFRLLNSPYRTPQSYVGGPRLDGALMASTGRTATTKAMGKGSTQVQHLAQIEVPPKLLEDWLVIWAEHYKVEGELKVQLRPHTSGSDLLAINILQDGEKMADVVFAPIQDRRDNDLLSIRDQNTAVPFRQKRLMTLIHLFLIHRYKSVGIHYVSPTDDNEKQSNRMKALRIYSEVRIEIGHIIVADVNTQTVKEILNPDQVQLRALIAKTSKFEPPK